MLSNAVIGWAVLGLGAVLLITIVSVWLYQVVLKRGYPDSLWWGVALAGAVALCLAGSYLAGRP